MKIIFLNNVVAPAPSANIEIRRGISTFPSRFLREDDAGWVIAAPHVRGKVIHLDPGEKLTMWAPTANGLQRFETKVLEPSDQKLLIAKPRRAKRDERRQAKRITAFANPAAKIEGVSAMLLDLSSYGARVFSISTVHKGERVKLDMDIGTHFGWVLESRGGLRGSVIRLCFEQPLSLRHP